MDIKEQIKKLCVPTKSDGYAENETYTPVCGNSIGNGKILVAVEPIGEGKVWYICVDSNYFFMNEDEKRIYEDTIHLCLEDDFGTKWEEDDDQDDYDLDIDEYEEEIFDDDDEEDDGFVLQPISSPYPAYQWEGGGISILNYDSFMRDFLAEYLSAHGFAISFDTAEEKKFCKNNREMSLCEKYLTISNEETEEQIACFRYDDYEVFEIIQKIQAAIKLRNPYDYLNGKDEIGINYTTEDFTFRYSGFSLGKQTEIDRRLLPPNPPKETKTISYCLSHEYNVHLIIPTNEEEIADLEKCENYTSFYKKIVAMIERIENPIIYTLSWNSIIYPCKFSQKLLKLYI